MQHQLSRGLRRLATDDDEAKKAEKTKAIIELVSNDLDFLFPLLRKFPKCYWIWNYRLWLLEECSKLLLAVDARRFWQQELGLAGKMLSIDNRNFHGWGYRRTVVAALESSSLDADGATHSMTEEEFKYTTRMIESNLSNFSAWHNRSKLIPRLLDERKADDTTRRSFLDKGSLLRRFHVVQSTDMTLELQLIQRGLWTDSNDQSLWFYHQYLMCNFDPEYASRSMASFLTTDERLRYVSKEFASLLDMLDGAEDCKWIYNALIQLSRLHRGLSDKWPVQEEQIYGWISQLRMLDPLRNGRWNDLEETLRLSK